jgi:hypothetical protein
MWCSYGTLKAETMDRLKKFTVWSATITLLILSAGCSLTEATKQIFPSPNSSPKTTAQPSEPKLPKITYDMGQLVSMADDHISVQLTVHSTREHKGQRALVPNEGNKWILVDTTIANKGEKPINLTVVSFELIDSEKKQYDVALLAGALDDVKIPTGKLEPGDKRRGEVPFEVPKNAKKLKLLFKPNSSECQAVAAKSKPSKTLNCEPIVVNLES